MSAGEHPDERPPSLEEFLAEAVGLIADGETSDGTERLLLVADDLLAQHDHASLAVLLEKIEELVPSISAEDPIFEGGTATDRDPGVEARLAYLNLAAVLLGRAGDTDGAGAMFARLRRLADLAGEPVFAVLADMNEGSGLLAAGEFERAEAALVRALEANRAIPDPYREVQLLVNLAYAQLENGELANARMSATSAVDAADGLRAPMIGASSRVALARVEAAEGDFSSASTTLKAGLSRARRSGLADLELVCLQNLAATSLDANEPRAAVRWARKAAHAADELGDPRAMATQHRMLGRALYDQGRHSQAIEEFDRARELSESSGQSIAAAEDTANVGAILVQLGEVDRGTSLLQAALASFVERGDPEWQVRVLRNLAQAQASVGEHGRAYATLVEAVAAAEDEETMADLYRQIGEVALEREDIEGASAAFRSGLELIPDASGRAWAAAEAGSLLDHAPEGSASAIAFYRGSLDTYLTLGNRQMEVQVRNDLGNALAQVRRFEEARSELLQCLELAGSLQDRRMRQQALFNLAEVSRRMDDAAGAVREAREALLLAEELDDRELTSAALDKLGHALVDAGQAEEARSQFERLGSFSDHDRASRLGGLAGVAFLGNRFPEAARLYEEAATLGEGRQRAEHVAGWLESLAHADLTRRLRRPTQKLVDIAQAEHLEDVAISGFTRSARVLFRNGRERWAGELYALAIALAGTRATELGRLTEEAIEEQLGDREGGGLLAPGIGQLSFAMLAPKVNATLDASGPDAEGRLHRRIVRELDELEAGLGSDMDDLLRWSWDNLAGSEHGRLDE